MTYRVPGASRAGQITLVLVLLAAVAEPVLAKDLSGFLDFTFADFDSEETISGLPDRSTRTEAFNRRLYFNFNRRAYPRLRFWVGGTFDSFDTTRETGGLTTDTDEWRFRPFVGIARRSRRWTAQLIWNRDQRRSEVSGFDTFETTRDNLLASANYRPESEFLPRATMSLRSSYDRDADKLQQDSTQNAADAGVRHQVNPKLRWTYRGSLSALDNRIADTRTETSAHRADVAYSDRFFNRRLDLSGRYSISYRELAITTGSGGAADLPVFALEGLAARDDTPLVGALPPEPGLIDDDLTTPTQIDLGLPPPGGDERPWGMGLSVGQGVTINAMLVWIDRELTPQVASSFVWQVYSSEDNQEWMPRQVVSSAPFDEFLRRFTIRFSNITERYVKLVVHPLDSSVPDASQFPDIFVTELDAAERVTAPDGRTESSDSFQRALVYTRARLLAEREFYYEGSVDAAFGRDRDLLYNMSHGLFFNHSFAPEAVLATRVSWQETGRGSLRERDLIYAASLTVRPVDRVSYSASVTGSKPDTESGFDSDRINVFFFGNANLYEGVDVQLGVGRNWIENPLGPTVTSDRVQFGSRIQPRQDLIFVLNYTDAVAEQSAGDTTGFQDVFTRLAQVYATYIPVSSVYLYAEYRKQWQQELAPLTFLRWAVNWAPFPRATLRLGVNYDETRSEPNVQSTRVISPFLRWHINSLSYFQLVYSDVREESGLLRRNDQRFSASLRWGF